MGGKNRVENVKSLFCHGCHTVGLKLPYHQKKHKNAKLLSASGLRVGDMEAVWGGSSGDRSHGVINCVPPP